MSASRAAASSARLPPWIPGVATPAFWFLSEVKGIIPPKWKRSVGAPAGFPGTALRGAWLPSVAESSQAKQPLPPGAGFRVGSRRCATRRGRPRPLPAAGQLNGRLAPWEPGRMAVAVARGHSARLVTTPPLLLLRLPRSSRGGDHREARTMVRGGSGALRNRTSVCRGACVFFHGSQVSLVWATPLAGACRELGPCSMWRCLVVTGLPRFIRVLSRLILDGFSRSHSESIVVWVLERRG